MSNLFNQASLVLVPSGYKAGKVYSQVPTSGDGDLTFTRASDATRVNSAGLIERVPYNLLEYSEQFDNSYWQKNAVTITANATNAPNGTLTAEQINETVTSISHGVYPYLGTSVVVGQSYSASIYVKKGNRSYCGLQAFYNSTNGAIAFFNLEDGTLLYQFAQGSGYSISDSSITNVGNDWYLLRCTFIFGHAIAYVGVCMASTQWTSGTSYNNLYTGDISKFMYIWGAQLVEGSTAKPYFPTTDRLNVPRLDYSGGGCPSLLLEPQRTNSFTQSESFANYYTNRVTATDLGTPSIFSSGSIARFTANNANAYFGKIISSVTSGSTYTVSGFFDLSEGIYAGITDGFNFRIFNLLTASVVGSGQGTLTISCKSTQVGSSNYYRVAFTFTATTTGTHFFVIGTNDGTINTTNETVAAGYFQREDSASYATSYIPTTSAAATRIGDAFTRNDIYTNGLISSSGGTWYVELKENELRTFTTENVGGGLELGNSTGNPTDAFKFRRGGGTQRVNIWKVVSGESTIVYVPVVDDSKVAIKWNGTSADVFVNGVKVVSATSFTATTSLEILRYIANQMPTLIQAMALYPTPLTDSECASLTGNQNYTINQAYANYGVASESPNCVLP